MKRFFYTARFQKLVHKLPESVKKKLQRQLKVLAVDVHHPSLGVKKMVNKDDLWEARVDLHYRLTFKRLGDQIILQAVGTHEIYRQP
jgi:mRNA-degrading endonuclease RelE of RelBE toxin-antitoxin system